MITILNSTKSKGFFPYLLWIPTALFLIFIIIYPLIYLVKNSMFFINQMTGIKSFVGLGNFIEVFKDPGVIISVKNTLIFFGCSLFLEFSMGILLAVLMWKYITVGQGILKTLLITPMMMTPVAVGLIFRWLFHTDMGIINYFLNHFGFYNLNWLATPGLAMTAIIIAEVWQWTSFVFLGCLAGLSAMSDEPIESAQIDGANSWQILRYIILPILKPIFLVVLVFRFVDMFKAFDIVYVLTEGGPGNATDILPFHLYKEAFRYFNTGYASAISWIILIVILFVTGRIIRRITEEQM